MSAAATSEDTRTEDAPLDDEDELLHIHCGRCWRSAREHAKPPRAFCGKQKYDWSRNVTDLDGRVVCVVCMDLVKNRVPCVVCGLKPARKMLP